uniref:metallophosphoesterase family protein n=1 Tax=Desulfobacter sp. UBA2225 TaxID=1961413 RepID=UPI00257ED62C
EGILTPPPGIKPGDEVIYMAESILPDGSFTTFASFPTRAALVHPFLRDSVVPDGKPFFIIQITDPHIVKRDSELLGVRTAERLEQAVAEINALEPLPDFVVVTGDIISDNPEGYALFHEIVEKLKVPCLPAFGNHDKPLGLGNAHRIFSEWGFPPYYALQHKGYDFFVLDTVAFPLPPCGKITNLQYAWLKRLLSSPGDLPRLFFLHHDICSGLSTTEHFEALDFFASYPGEKWFFSGHWHCDTFVKRENERHIITSAIGYLFKEERKALKHARHTSGYRLIHFKDGKISTQFKPLGKPAIDDPSLDDYFTWDELQKALKK